MGFAKKNSQVTKVNLVPQSPKSERPSSRVWWHMPAISALERWRQRGHEFEASLGCIERSCLSRLGCRSMVGQVLSTCSTPSPIPALPRNKIRVSSHVFWLLTQVLSSAFPLISVNKQCPEAVLYCLQGSCLWNGFPLWCWTHPMGKLELLPSKLPVFYCRGNHFPWPI
jgi:hypothetical protein